MPNYVSPLANSSAISRGIIKKDDGSGTYIHTGIDMIGNVGDRVGAAAGGTVIWSGFQGSGSGKNGTGYGNAVVIRDNTTGIAQLYAHLSSIDSSITVGAQVSTNQQLGIIGITGHVDAKSSGGVLHIEILPPTTAAAVAASGGGQPNANGVVKIGIDYSEAYPRIDPLNLIPHSGNSAINLNINNQSTQSNSQIAKDLDNSAVWSGISNPGQVSIFDGFNDDIFTPYSNSLLNKSILSLSSDRYNLNGGWSGLGSSNSHLDDFTFSMGGSNYTLFGKDEGISLSGISSGSAYGGYDWSRDFMGSTSSSYFRPTSTIYEGVSFMGNASNHNSPLAIDLNGNGIETTDIYNDARVYFDIDNDGFAERVGWIKPSDGLLAMDRNSNGTIDNITELFGDYRMTAWNELRLLDSDSDGKINFDSNHLFPLPNSVEYKHAPLN